LISIIIPNYNGLKHLKVCFDSLKRQSIKDFIIVFVDNNSDDKSVEFIEKYYPETYIIKQDYNTGFARGVNSGIKFSLKISDVKYLLLLNNDIECDENFVEEMLKGFITSDTGSVACKMLNYFDRKVIDDAGDFIKINGSPYARGFGDNDTGQYDKEEFIFGACAGAALYKRYIFEKVGFFDEDFFAYYEDVDFDLRMQLMGYKCFYNPKAICYHKRGATTKKNIGYQTMLCEKNLIALRIKNYPFITLLKYEPHFLIGRLIRYYRFLRDHSILIFLGAIKGYISGMLNIYQSLRKRISIQNKKILSVREFEDLFRN